MAAARTDSLLALMGRIFWMTIGPAGLVICAAVILMSPGTGWHTAADITYLAMLAGMLMGRYAEHKGGSPRNTMGEPSSAGELRRYVVTTLIAGVAMWVVVNLVSNYALA